MSSSKKNSSRIVLTFATTFSAFSFGLIFSATGSRADDRFNVPTAPSGSGSPSSTPSSSSSNSDSGSSSPASSSSDSGSNRFNVPVPNNSSSNSTNPPNGPWPSGREIGHGGHSSYIPYWGGYYYWDGDYYFWGGHRYMSGYGNFGRYPFYPEFRNVYRSDRTANRDSMPIFFPPNPPPIGAPIPPKQAPGERIVAPTELAKFVYEPFYAPLSTRFSEQDLTKKLMTRLDNYQAKRNDLQTELQKKLISLKDASPADRIQELETFAREQTPRIAALEAVADQLRSDLLRGGLVGMLSGTGDWNQARNWVLGRDFLAKPRDQTIVYEFLVMRAAVFYQEGLSPAQRRLLREVAMELQVEAFKPKSEESSKKETDLVFFSPETARIRVSDDLPADLAVKIAAYQSEKNAIKTELRDTLYQQDSAPASRRVQALKQLAESHEPRIAALEGLADDIRASLSRLPKHPGPSTPPAFSPELAKHISAYQKEKLAVQKLVQSKLEEIRTRLTPDASILLKKSGDDISHPSYGLELSDKRYPEEKMTLIREAIADLNKQNAQRFADLAKDRNAIRDEVARFTAAHPEMTGEKSVRSLLQDFFTALREEEAWQPYQDYQTAVYQPGLSSEQRRLLFEVALEKLSLPLPDGEFQQ